MKTINDLKFLKFDDLKIQTHLNLKIQITKKLDQMILVLVVVTENTKNVAENNKHT
jgi:hypothetical protein